MNSEPVESDHESTQLAPPQLERHSSASSISSGFIRSLELTDVPVHRARPPEGNASNVNDVDPTVPNFPNLHRGSAVNDGDCLFHSVIHLAGPLLVKHANVETENLTAAAVRQHTAASMITEFHTHNVNRQYSTANEDLYSCLTDFQDGEAPSRQELAHLLEDHLVEPAQTLTPTQQAHVANVARPRQFSGITADLMPRLLADAFPGLRLITHDHNSTPESLADCGTFLREPGAHPSDPPTQTVRLFLDNEHYEPIFEGPPRSS